MEERGNRGRMPNATAPECGIWVSASGNIRVEYSLGVLEDIRAAAVEGLCRFPRGGIEIGGVLLGSAGDGVVRVTAARPVQCSYAHGPSFTLTQADEAAFRNAMHAGTSLAPVGWYHSHTRCGIEFSAADTALHDRLFPEPWHVALVLRPEPFGSAEAVFFARGDDGRIEPVPHGSFVLRPGARLSDGSRASTRGSRRVEQEPETAGRSVGVLALEHPPRREVPAHAPQPDPQPVPVPASTVAEGARPVTPSLHAEPQTHPPAQPRSPRNSRRLIWAGAAMSVAGVAAVAIWSGLFSRPAPAIPPHLALHVAESDGQLQITWDRNSAPLKTARRGSVSIRDGGRNVTIPFEAERLRAGGLTYARTSEEVEVRLRVEGPVPVEESVRLFGTPVQARPATPAPSVPAVPGVVETPHKSREEPLRKQPETVGLASLRTSSDRERVRTDEPDREPPGRVFRSVVLPERTQAAASLPLPPPVQADPALGRAAIQPWLPSAAPPPERGVAPAPERRRPTPAVPSAGRVIWVGRLERGQALAILGQRASSGVLTGELPGVPVRISAYPAELGGGQLRIFASNPGVKGTREAAGPQNGWNPTTYSWDERRLADVLVTQAPSPENAWRGMSLRGNGQPVSVIVIDWKAAQP